MHAQLPVESVQGKNLPDAAPARDLAGLDGHNDGYNALYIVTKEE